MRHPLRTPASPAALVAPARRVALLAGEVLRRLGSVRTTLPAVPAPFFHVRVPPLEGPPGAWFVRGPDGRALPVDPADADGLRAVARQLRWTRA